MARSDNNPLFTRSEKKRVRKKIAHKVKGAARSGFSKLFGIPLSPGLGGKPAPRRRHRSGATSSAGVRGDVVSAMRNLGYRGKQAEEMVPQPRNGEGFESLFRRAVAKNPGELIIFGNPEKVYRKAQLRKVNPLPAALLEGLGYTAGSEAVDALRRLKPGKIVSIATGRRKRTRLQKEKTKKGKRNPHTLSQARELFEQFHKRPAAGVFELQRSAKQRKDFTILGPLVAIGTNAEKFDRIRPREEDVVLHWDKLPHFSFLTGPQVEKVKRVLADPDKYLSKIALLASSPNGKQLYVISEEPQNIDVTKFETDPQKDFVDLGEATFIVYLAKKPQEVLEWVHTFAEEGGQRPRLGYARLAKEVFFIGGSYRVEAPGIIN